MANIIHILVVHISVTHLNFIICIDLGLHPLSIFTATKVGTCQNKTQGAERGFLCFCAVLFHNLD